MTRHNRNRIMSVVTWVQIVGACAACDNEIRTFAPIATDVLIHSQGHQHQWVQVWCANCHIWHNDCHTCGHSPHHSTHHGGHHGGHH